MKLILQAYYNKLTVNSVELKQYRNKIQARERYIADCKKLADQIQHTIDYYEDHAQYLYDNLSLNEIKTEIKKTRLLMKKVRRSILADKNDLWEIKLSLNTLLDYSAPCSLIITLK